ncbi:MAG: hypothetical protein N4A63_03155 [Vallitalea sp.]|nr:hypothetical protein [Vallitalea sp.]
MRKFIAILILVCLGIFLFVIFDSKMSDGNLDDTLLSSSDRLLKDLKDDYEGTIEKITEIKKSPEQVIQLNNIIMQKLYSHEITEDDIELLLKVQRKLYNSMLLDNNPIEAHLIKAKEEIKAYKKNNTKIIGSDIQKDDSRSTENKSIIKVVFHLNIVGPNGEVYEEYILVKNEGLWEILGWQKTDEFIIVGEKDER